MEWLTGLALLPVLFCGGMMLGGMALAALGLRRTTSEPSKSSSPAATDDGDRAPEGVVR